MVRSIVAASTLVCPLLASAAWAQPHGAAAAPAAKLDWSKLEAPLLTNHVQLTHRDRNGPGDVSPGFVKAGEAYFDHHTSPRWVIFQATVQPDAGKDPDPFYAMFVARLLRDDQGRITGIDDPVRVSPPDSANTCGWFHPTIPWRVLFGSTVARPSDDQPAGFQVGSRKYVWMFPREMDIVYRDVMPIHQFLQPGPGGAPGPRPEGWTGAVTRLIDTPNYDAECSYSSDGRYVLYAHVRDEPSHGRPDADLWIHDTVSKTSRALVTADGYDGGPFFSPDGKMICYRSDRKGDDLLQLFVARIKFDEAGVPVGIESEHQVTDDAHVNWAPYWHPSGKFIVYGSSGVGHSNYEIFAVAVDTSRTAKELRKRRVTFASGADVLPVFSADGSLMLWTAQRGPMIDGESRPSSQLWVAEVAKADGGFSDPDRLFDNLPPQHPESADSPAPAAQPAQK